ncbi:MAG TPA: DsbA family protein [Acidimicrobiales bacterium]|jgi:protein-disulfide isomerase-like protein with CxxC motif|nr:DsbA family protein [Acidimicrobiales bacterium]
MSSPAFSVTWDYLCPFARNAHEHLLAGLAGGAGWEVSFTPFSLMQNHVSEGETPVWDAPDQARAVKGMLALQAGLVVRDRFPGQFPAVHRALFAARHDEGRSLTDVDVVADVLEKVGVPPQEVLVEIDSGRPLEAIRRAHEASVTDHQVFGVPTFVIGDKAVFVRLMTRPDGDGEMARSTVEAVLDLMVTRPEINEFKYTTVSR